MGSDSISLVGLGKLGLCLASCLAERGFKVYGIDLENHIVDSVNQGRAAWHEPGLADLLARCGGKNLVASQLHADAIAHTDTTIVLVATPSNPDGSFSNRFVVSALRSLAESLKQSDKPNHHFIISSTVMPGSTNELFIPTIERTSGRRLNAGFDVCYDPDFVSLGNVVHGFLNPDLVVIGQSHEAAGDHVSRIHQQLCMNQPAISRMSLISAELAKVCLNAYITMKISFANSVANLCERIPGADPDAITSAIGADRRISPHYFRPGISFGGTCFPRDVRAYLTVAEKCGVTAPLLQATDQVNKYQDESLAARVLGLADVSGTRTVGILGLAFTPNTAVIVESPAIRLIQRLLERDFSVMVYDPLATDAAKGVLGSTVGYCRSVAECLERSEVAVLTLRSPEMARAIESQRFSRPATLVDCWRIVDPQKLDRHVVYVPLGRHSA